MHEAISQEKRLSAIRMLKTGKYTYRQISMRVGVSETSVANLATKHGLNRPRRPAGFMVEEIEGPAPSVRVGWNKSPHELRKDITTKASKGASLALKAMGVS